MRAAEDVDVHQAPRQPAEPGREAFEHLLRELGAVQDLAHPDEQRQRGERPRGARAPERLEQVHVGRRGGEELQPEPGHRGERDRDPHAAGEQHQQQAEQDQARERAVVTRSPRSRRRRAGLPRRAGRPAFCLRSTATSSSRTATKKISTPSRKLICGIQIGTLDQALRDFVELPALVDEARRPPRACSRRTAR